MTTGIEELLEHPGLHMQKDDGGGGKEKLEKKEQKLIDRFKAKMVALNKEVGRLQRCGATADEKKAVESTLVGLEEEILNAKLDEENLFFLTFQKFLENLEKSLAGLLNRISRIGVCDIKDISAIRVKKELSPIAQLEELWKEIIITDKPTKGQTQGYNMEKAAEIRKTLLKKKIILSHKTGAILFSLGLILAYSLFPWISLYSNLEGILLYIVAFLSEALVLYFSFLTGRCLGSLLSGIKFEGFYMYDPLEFGVRIEYVSYLKATQGKRTLLFGIPILWEHIIMISQVIILWHYKSPAIWIPLAFLIIMLPFMLVIHKKAKTGELHRFFRELKILREIKRKLKTG